MEYRLNTVCEGARCPNREECYGNGTATFMILGDTCTRACGFCAVQHAKSLPAPDASEPVRVAQAVEKMGLKHVVITSVTRDDLPDGGAAQFVSVIDTLRRLKERVTIEVLVPDFMGDMQAVRSVLEAGPDVFNHNLETVARLYPRVKPQGSYRRSLDVLREASGFNHRGRSPVIKTGLMLGMGEKEAEVEAAMVDLLEAGCHVLTLGQYLRPDKTSLPVHEYINPERFAAYRRKGLEKGFASVIAGPFVRSSFHAGEVHRHLLSQGFNTH